MPHASGVEEMRDVPFSLAKRKTLTREPFCECEGDRSTDEYIKGDASRWLVFVFFLCREDMNNNINDGKFCQ